MNRKFFIYLLLIVAAYGCKKDKAVTDVKEPVVEKDSVELSFVKIEKSKNPGKVNSDIYGVISEKEINLFVPELLKNKKFITTFATKNASITVNDTLQVSGVTSTDFSKSVNYKLTSPKGTTKTYKFNIKYFTSIPILYLNTTDSVTSKDVYVTGNLIVDPNNLENPEKLNIPLQVKGRGNSTWDKPKKPYRLKFNTKSPILGMETAKNWVLLANYSDKTLIRTSIAFDLGAKIGADFTPKGRFVELVMNNYHVGNYFLTSQVEVNENRVNITELKKGNTSADEITGGYLLEQDKRLDEKFWFKTTADIPFTIKSPEEITEDQLTYIHNYIQQTEDAIYSADFADPEKGYAKYIKVESFINWFLVQELLKNEDAKEFSSNFYYKERNGKLGLGPLWDFDLSCGNNDYSNSRYPTGWWVKDGPWFSHLFKDPAFRQKVKLRWNQIRGKEINEITSTIDKTVAYIDLSQKKNFNRWLILDQYVWPNQFVLGTYPKEVAQLKAWLTERIAWLDKEMNNL